MPEGFLPWYELEVDGANYLTEGGFSEIYRAKWLESEVIVKQVKLTNTTNLDSWAYDSLIITTTPETRNANQTSKPIREMFEDEVGVWFGLSHPHVVCLFGACHVGTPLFVCEFASAGSLDKYLRKHPNEMWQKLHEAALGVQYLHSRDIVHADLKCNNIVVGGDNKAKVTDFGLSSASIVTGAWHWVAPECLERGPSELSTMSDIYALGMCIVEALRIVEITTNNSCCVSIPWGKLENNVVKYHVTRKKLPKRPKYCTDDAWCLVERMCAYDPSDRIKISTMVDEIAAFAKPDKVQTFDLEQIITQEQIEQMKLYCCLMNQDRNRCSSTQLESQVVLSSMYGIFWDRIQNLYAMPNADSGCLQPLFNLAWVKTQKLKQNPSTLAVFTEMAIDGYALHSDMDKVIEANFWRVDTARGGLHDWKSKWYASSFIPRVVRKKTGMC